MEEERQAAPEENKPDKKKVVTVNVPEEARAPLSAPTPEAEKPPQEEQVRVEQNLLDLLAGIALPFEEEERVKEQRNLDHTIHKLLIIGLILSTSLMLIGLFLDLVLQRVVPTSVPDLGEVFTRVIYFRPSGFLALGLLVLIATPVLRVIGSIIAFIYERDWRYAGITFVVLLVVIFSIVLGKG